jgi:MFS family permease
MSTLETEHRVATWGPGEFTSRGLALVLLILAMLGVIWMMPLRTEIPAGCDDFGYLRQAELFRAQGVDGFRTDLATPPVDWLISTMKDSKFDTSWWYQAVAPHCHHYRASSGDVIIQYPPGAGWLMALFPSSEQERLLRITATVATGAVFALLVGLAPTAVVAGLGLAAGALAMLAASYGTDSVPPATAMAALCGLLAVPALERRNLLTLALFGVLCGLGGSMRAPNLIIPAAAGLALFVSLVGQASWGRFGALATFGVAVVVGYLPVAWAGYVNTGSFLSTTYSPIDASAPRFDMDSLLRGLEYYYRFDAQGLLLIGASAATLLMFAERPKSPVVATTFVAMLASLLYFLPKDVLISYYPTPISAFALAVAVGWAANGAPSPWSRLATGTTMAAVVLGLGAAFCLLRPFPPTPVPPMAPAVSAALERDPIVWADLSGGRFVMGNGVYSAKLNFTSDEIQDYMVDAASAAGQPQLLVADTDTMRKIIERLGTRYRLTPLGQAYNADVFEIGPAIATPPPTSP